MHRPVPAPVVALRVALQVCLLAAPQWAAAQIFKCADDRRQAVYQDTPCPPGRELANLALQPSPVSVIPLRPVPGTVSRATAATVPKPRAAPARKGSPVTGDAAERRHLHPGMYEGEVIASVGAPDMKSGGGSRKTARWTYLPSARDPQTLTTVLFEYGKIVEVERKVIR
jgi:Domain of unknown function (DUF4124)